MSEIGYAMTGEADLRIFALILSWPGALFLRALMLSDTSDDATCLKLKSILLVLFKIV